MRGLERKPRSFHLEVNPAYKRYAEVEVFRRKRRKHMQPFANSI